MAEVNGGSELTHAENRLRAAMQLDQSGNYQEAFEAYSEALDVFFKLARTEPDDDKRSSIMGFIETYLGRAEQLKYQLQEIPGVAAAAAAAAAKPTRGDSSHKARQDKNRKLDDYDYTSGRQPRKKPANTANGTAAAAHKTPAAAGNTAAGAKEENAIKSTEPKKNDKAEYEEVILNEMLDRSPGIKWEDIAGLQFAKQTLQEAVVLPNLRPDLFTGLRQPPKGVLLFGPPGTGKTMLAKAVASESGFAFFSITASSVTSKYLGEGEKLMRGLFAVARKRQPAVIFFDEIDALLSSRREGEHEASRRLKTEFLIQLDGVASEAEDRILVMGATNMPQDVDAAVLRRMVKRIYIPLPDAAARKALITHLLTKQVSSLSERQINNLVDASDGYSGSDLTAMCKEAAMGPIRELSPDQLRTTSANDVRPVTIEDFRAALQTIRPSVSATSLQAYDSWNSEFGSN